MSIFTAETPAFRAALERFYPALAAMQAVSLNNRPAPDLGYTLTQAGQELVDAFWQGENVPLGRDAEVTLLAMRMIGNPQRGVVIPTRTAEAATP